MKIILHKTSLFWKPIFLIIFLLSYESTYVERIILFLTPVQALAPLSIYLQFFKKYENFVNIDIGKYIGSRIAVTMKDPDSAEIELPVVVNLPQLIALIDEHLAQIKVTSKPHKIS